MSHDIDSPKSPEPAKELGLGSIKQRAKYDWLAVTVNSLKRTSSLDYLFFPDPCRKCGFAPDERKQSLESLGEFVVLDMVLENIGKTPAQLRDIGRYFYGNSSGFLLWDSQDRIYSSERLTYLFREESFDTSYLHLQPNVPVNGQMAFEVPKDSKGLKLRLPLLKEGERAFISLEDKVD